MRPFGGDTQASLIGSILKDDPEPPSRAQPLAPERLDWIVKRCLEKDLERRWQSAREVVIEIEALRVVPRRSAQAVKGADIATVGELLDVGAVVQGSLQSSDNHLRVTVQLIGVSDGENIWSARYERKPDEVLVVQEEIAREVADVIRSELGVSDSPVGVSPCL